MTKLELNPSDYYMPAEWEPQEAVWLSWPHNAETFENFLPQVEEIYIQFIKALTPYQGVSLCVNSLPVKNALIHRFQANSIDVEMIQFYIIPTKDIWIRDYGPIFVKPKEIDNKVLETASPPLIMLNWGFNAWGNKYDDLKPDTHIPFKIHQILNIPLISPQMVLEGGSIDVNGIGALLTTEQCLLHPNRNPHLTKQEIEKKIFQYLGINQVFWLKAGIVGDDTDGHIDDIARFVSVDKILYAVEENKNDENHAILKENFDILSKIKTNFGKEFELCPIPMPDPVYYKDTRLPASYINFCIGNDVVLVPIFGQEKDKIALHTIQSCFPKRKVIEINCKAMVYGLGTLHCGSQQQPSI